MWLGSGGGPALMQQFPSVCFDAVSQAGIPTCAREHACLSLRETQPVHSALRCDAGRADVACPFSCKGVCGVCAHAGSTVT